MTICALNVTKLSEPRTNYEITKVITDRSSTLVLYVYGNFALTEAYKITCQCTKEKDITAGKCSSSFELKTSFRQPPGRPICHTLPNAQEMTVINNLSLGASYLGHVKYGHNPEKTVQCPKCKGMFQSAISMMSHRRKQHGKVTELVKGYTME